MDSRELVQNLGTISPNITYSKARKAFFQNVFLIVWENLALPIGIYYGTTCVLVFTSPIYLDISEKFKVIHSIVFGFSPYILPVLVGMTTYHIVHLLKVYRRRRIKIDSST